MYVFSTIHELVVIKTCVAVRGVRVFANVSRSFPLSPLQDNAALAQQRGSCAPGPADEATPAAPAQKH